MGRIDIEEERERQRVQREVEAELNAEEGFERFVWGVLLICNVIAGFGAAPLLILTIPISVMIAFVVGMFRKTLYNIVSWLFGLLFLLLFVAFVVFVAYVLIQAQLENGGFKNG